MAKNSFVQIDSMDFSDSSGRFNHQYDLALNLQLE